MDMVKFFIAKIHKISGNLSTEMKITMSEREFPISLRREV